LAEKYRTLLRWRQRRDADEPAPERTALRTLAEAYPGALRELDTLGEPELARRAAVADAAALGGPREPWMAWVLALHRLLAAALFLKRAHAKNSGGKSGDTREPPNHSSLTAEAERIAGTPLSNDLVTALLSPPGGRATPIALAAVATRFQQPVAVVAATLLPSRRRPH
jgi:hypothetical protein